MQQLSYIANHIAVHSVSNLKSQDNVTVMIVLLQGGEDNSAQIALADEEEANIRRRNAALVEELENLKIDSSLVGDDQASITESLHVQNGRSTLVEVPVEGESLL